MLIIYFIFKSWFFFFQPFILDYFSSTFYWNIRLDSGLLFPLFICNLSITPSEQTTSFHAHLWLRLLFFRPWDDGRAPRMSTVDWNFQDFPLFSTFIFLLLNINTVYWLFTTVIIPLLVTSWKKAWNDDEDGLWRGLDADSVTMEEASYGFALGFEMSSFVVTRQPAMTITLLDTAGIFNILT